MFKKFPSRYELYDLFNMSFNEANTVRIDGKLFPARPIGFISFAQRIKCAWLVFTGKADAVVWPGGQ